MIRRTATGFRCGEHHQRSKLSDDDVELIRQLYEIHQMPVSEIARKFETPYHTVMGIVKYRSRYA